MKSKSKDLKKNISARKASLGGVLKKNEKIKETVKEAASKLTRVNEVLKEERVPIPVMREAITQNKEVESKVAKAAEDLKLVNVKLAKEMASG